MIHMDLYKITSFKPTGELVVDENFEAENDDAAKAIGEQKLQELGNAMSQIEYGKYILQIAHEKNN